MTANVPAGAPPQEGSNPLELALVALLALVCLLTPYLYSSPTSEGASVGNELVYQGRALLTGHEVLRAIPEDNSRLFDTLTTTWWGDVQPTVTTYRPLSSFVLGLGAVVSGEAYDAREPGAAAVPYKLFAISLKIICALLVVELGALLLGSRRRGFVAGLLFATLPVHGEALFDVAGTAELLGTALSLAAWTAWLRAGDRPLEKPGALAVSLALLFAAIHAHEFAYALPLVFFLGDLGRVREGGVGAGLSHALAKLPALVACGLVVGLSVGVRYGVTGAVFSEAGNMAGIANPLVDADPLTRAMNAIRILVGTVAVTIGINPFSSNWMFSADYSLAQIPVLGAFALPNLIALAVLVGAVVLALALFAKCRTRATLVLCYFASLLVVSNLIVTGETIFSERYLVFPSAILALFVAPFLANLGTIGVGVALVAALANGFWTWSRADVWQSDADLWRYTESKSATESARAAYEEGLSLAREQLSGLAVTRFERALAIAPDFDLARAQKAGALMASFRTDEALAALREVVENRIDATDRTWQRDPVMGPLNVDLLLFQITQTDGLDPAGSAERHLEWLDSLLASGYESPYVHLYRAETLSNMPGRADEAEAAFEASLAIEPVPAAVRGYGSFLRRRGRNDEALALYQGALAEVAEAAAGDVERAAQIEFRLQEADLEYLRDAAAAYDLADALLTEPDLTDEQRSRALILRAQARLDTVTTADPLAAATAVADSARDLQAALAAYQVQSEQSYIALYMLVDLFLQQGRVGLAEQTIRELTSFRRSPTLHGRLADIYARFDRRAEAAEQYELAVSGLVGLDGAPIDPGYYTRVRMMQLHNLKALGEEDAIAAALAAEAARGDGAAASVRAFWAAAQAEWAAMSEAIALMQATLGEETVAQSVEALGLYQEVSTALAASSTDPGALTFQAERALELFNLPQALASIGRALDLTPAAENDARAYRLGVLARALEAQGDPAGALERLREAVGLTGVDPQGQAILEAEVARLEALLTL